jgi:hypothetical protein
VDCDRKGHSKRATAQLDPSLATAKEEQPVMCPQASSRMDGSTDDFRPHSPGTKILMLRNRGIPSLLRSGFSAGQAPCGACLSKQHPHGYFHTQNQVWAWRVNLGGG